MATVLVQHFEIGVIPFVVVYAYLHCPSIDINVEWLRKFSRFHFKIILNKSKRKHLNTVACQCSFFDRWIFHTRDVLLFVCLFVKKRNIIAYIIATLLNYSVRFCTQIFQFNTFVSVWLVREILIATKVVVLLFAWFWRKFRMNNSIWMIHL